MVAATITIIAMEVVTTETMGIRMVVMGKVAMTGTTVEVIITIITTTMAIEEHTILTMAEIAIREMIRETVGMVTGAVTLWTGDRETVGIMVEERISEEKGRKEILR